MQTAMATATSPENEITVYAKMTNLEGLKEASVIELHEQYEMKPATKTLPDGSNTAGKGKIRVRKTTTGEVVRYEMTTKVKTSAGKLDSNMEYTVPIDVEYFNAFKSICSSGMTKTRYLFPINKTVLTGISEGETDISFAVKKKQACYQVDVFSDPEGNTYSWCKIDIEIDAITEVVFDRISDDTNLKIVAKVSSLPFGPKEMFIGRSATEEQKKLMDYLYENMFTIKM